MVISNNLAWPPSHLSVIKTMTKSKRQLGFGGVGSKLGWKSWWASFLYRKKAHQLQIRQ
jgi:hypothetical protein